VGQKWSLEVTFHVLGIVRKCEGMNPHIPNWAPTLGLGVPMDFRIFRGQFQGSKPIGLKSSLYHWKSLQIQMSKMGLYDPFGYFKHKLWPKEMLVVKVPIWLPITKSRESPLFTCVQVACYRSLESLWQGIQNFLDLTSIEGEPKKLWASKVIRIPISRTLGFPTWESRNKMTFGCKPHGHAQRIL
jgi:hypothetical protein